jgi:hypothetical protein
MTGPMKRLRSVLFAGGVGAALVFGAASLRAEVRPAVECNDPFANGACTTTAQCAKFCQGVMGAGTGSCSRGCCWCIWF